MNSPSHNDSDYKYGRFDASALHIAHALKQTELQKAYNKRREKPIDYYLVSHYSASSWSWIFRPLRSPNAEWAGEHGHTHTHARAQVLLSIPFFCSRISINRMWPLCRFRGVCMNVAHHSNVVQNVTRHSLFSRNCSVHLLLDANSLCASLPHPTMEPTADESVKQRMRRNETRQNNSTTGWNGFSNTVTNYMTRSAFILCCWIHNYHRLSLSWRCALGFRLFFIAQHKCI